MGETRGCARSTADPQVAGWLGPPARPDAGHIVRDSLKTIVEFNPKDARDRGWVYIAEYVVMKMLLVLLAVTIANVSPVLQVLVRLLPM